MKSMNKTIGNCLLCEANVSGGTPHSNNINIYHYMIMDYHFISLISFLGLEALTHDSSKDIQWY